MITIATGKSLQREVVIQRPQPVQRIPRYMLFIKVILNHTDQGHPDHAHLADALEELTALAECVNEAERQSSLFNQQQELLIMIGWTC